MRGRYASKRRARSFSSRFRPRFGPALHVPKKTARWEWGNFRIFANLVSPSPGPNQTGILYSIIAQQSNMFDQTTNPGQSLTKAARALEVGGVVYTHQLLPIHQQIPQTVIGVPNILHEGIWLSDILDSSGLPISTAFNWATTTPTAIATVAQNDEKRFPLRIHQRFATYFSDVATFNTSVTATQGTTPYALSAHSSKRSGSLRLRLTLEDNQALIFANILQSGPNYPNLTAGADVVLTGSIYYRLRF